MSRPSLYRYFAADDRLLYIGSTKNFALRDKQHEAGGTGAWWYPLVARSEVADFESMEEAAQAEREAIAVEAPAYNIVHTTRRRMDDLLTTAEERRLFRRWGQRPRNCAGWWLA